MLFAARNTTVFRETFGTFVARSLFGIRTDATEGFARCDRWVVPFPLVVPGVGVSSFRMMALLVVMPLEELFPVGCGHDSSSVNRQE